VLVQTRALAVPGFTVADALARTINLASITDPIDAMAVQVLGFPGLALGTAPCGTLAFSFPSLTISEVACAISMKPTLVVNWLGNNDALQSLTLNLPPTNPLAFAAAYHMAMTALNTTKAPIVVANIPDVSVLPFLIPVPAFEQLCHFHPPGTTAADFIVPNLVDPTATSFNICTNFAVRSASLIASTQQAVSAYNNIIKGEAKAFDAVLVDINKLFDKISKKGFDVNGQNLTTAFLGGLFSLDGIHPTNTGYAILANEFIDAMNKELDTSVPRVSVEQVAKNDPLVFGKH
jgi:lysophospholipase L1-like esterase